MGKIHFDLTLDTKDFTASVRQAEAAAGNLTRKVKSEGDQMDAVFKKLAKGAASLGVAFSAQQFVSNIVKIRGEFQQTEIAMETMLGSADKADALISQLVQTAAKTPFGMTDITQGAKQLLAYGVASEEVNDTLIRLGNVASGLSIPLNDLVYLYGTTMTQGRVFTQDMRQFMGRGIPLADELAKQFGVSKDKVNELVTAGKVGFPEVKKAIESMTNEGGKFYNLMEKQSSSLTGQISNLEDAWDMMLNDLGEKIQGIAGTGISIAGVLVENYEKVGKVIVGVAASYGTYRAALLAVAAAEKVQAVQRLAAIKHTTAMSIATGALKKQMAGLSAVMKTNPYVLLASAVVGVTAAIFSFNKRQNEAVKTTGDASRKINEETQALKELFDAAKDQTKSEKERADAIDKINARYGDKLKNLLSEKSSVDDLTQAYQQLTAAITEKYLAEVKESMVGKQQKKFTNAQNTLYGRVQNIAGKSGLSQKQQGRMTAQMQEWITKYGEYNNATEVYDALTKIYEDYGGKELSNNAYSKLFGSIWDFKDTQEQLDLAEKGYNEYAVGYKSVISAISNEATKATAEQRTSLSDIVKNLESMLAKMKSLRAKAAKEGLTEAEAKELAQTSTEVDEAKKKYKEYTGREYGKTDNAISKSNTALDKTRATSEKAAARKLEDIENEVAQAQINAMANGAEKTRKQRELDNKLEIQQIERNKEDYINALVERARAIQDAEQEAAAAKNGNGYKKETFNEAGARKTAERSQGAQAYDTILADTRSRQESTRLKAEADAMQEYLIQYGTYEEKKLNITQKYAALIAEAETEGGRMSLVKQQEEELYELEQAYKKTAGAIQDLFADLSHKSAKDLNAIADEGEKALAFLKGSEWSKDNAFGISEETFNQIKDDPSKLKDIADAIEQIRGKADDLEPAFRKITEGIKEFIKAGRGTEDFDKSLSKIKSGVGEITNAANFLSESFSSVGDALGVEWMTDAASGIDSAVNVTETTMKGAEIGASFGPIGAAAGAAVGLVSSLATEIGKAHDAAKQKTIDKLANDVAKLNDEYNDLADSIDKAYSVDKADLIDQQNANLEAQNANLEKMIKAEEGKKKSDKKQIEEWNKQINENNKQIEENIEKAQEAINGISFDSFRDKFKDALMDMEGSADDWADDVSDIIRNAMYDDLLKDFNEESEPLLKELAEALNEGDEARIKETEKQLNELYDKYKPQAEKIDKNHGSNKSTRSATSKGIAQASQDSVDELNGRMTAIQSHTFSINNGVLSLVDTTSQMLARVTAIETNTGFLRDIERSVLEVRSEVENMRLHGIKVNV